jgi:hypothetical protein
MCFVQKENEMKGLILATAMMFTAGAFAQAPSEPPATPSETQAPAPSKEKKVESKHKKKKASNKQ